MKFIKLPILIFGLLFFGCAQADSKTKTVTEEQVSDWQNDTEQIRNLIRQVLIWAKANNSIELLPVIPDIKDSVYFKFDLDIHKQNISKLKLTNFFSTEFIENYNQIILTLDDGLRNGKYEKWLVNDMPTFIFANDYDPWCNCQDYLDWNKVEVKKIFLNNDKGEFEWFWGNIDANYDTSWKDLKYKFSVIKENNEWKIAYMSGFDFKESTRKDGQL